MDPELESNMRFYEHDRCPNTPRLSIEVEPTSPVISLANPGGFIVTIRRAEDDCDKPCIFRWNFLQDGWGPSGFMLFQRTPDGLKRVEGTPKLSPLQKCKLTGYEAETEELLPGQTLQRNIGYPYPFWDHMVAGERYELFWPGAEYALWAWGTLREHWGQEIGAFSGLPPVAIPGGPCCSFTCVEVEERSDSEPDDPRVEKSERIPGTPCISVFLEGPSTISRREKICITVKITYEGLANGDHEASCADTQPIIIHDYPFSGDNFRLQRRCHEQWKTYFDDEQNPGWMIVDEPDVEVNVADSAFFCSLKPGETLVRHHSLGYLDLHPDTLVGDTYRYRYWGGCVDWWIWGDREEHAKTVVKLPCWLNDHVVDPADNDGRPVVMAPSSNFVEFTVVD
ncbi:hypothetical protein ATEIFO6365_0010037000 [Aspergillus terreus]|uniref:Uncharacterized protein n=1 Tax=Aspergillus terreus TaxID=33178 RepID=A0A5M3ZDA8_ASPTE|nr:hypothetical protein ATETN484_0012034900 [Aspergillus terreus]GFF19597.1 hypothetical protein ATEIFO6365_0010037000 [Aspergillus terreus]